MLWDDDALTASSISTTPVSSGCHVLKINGYSQTKLLLSHGMCATSPEFEAGGQPWRINYYPNGKGRDATDYISLRIEFAGNVGTATITAKIRFSLLPHDRNDGADPYGKSFTAQYRGSGRSYYDSGVSCFISREALEKSEYLVDDCFAVRCDIDVVKTSAVAADPKVKHDQDLLQRLALPCTCHDQLCKRIHLVALTQEEPGEQCKRSSPSTPPRPQRRHRVTAAWFRFFGCGQV